MDFQELLDIFTTRYLTKKEIMYRLPSQLKINNFWPEILTYRKEQGQVTNLKDQQGGHFWLCAIPYKETLNTIEVNARKTVVEQILGIVRTKQSKIEKELIIDALIDEAFNSSVIEGAFSTKKRSKELIQKKQKPLNISEQMIFNNYKALEYILNNLDHPINESITLEIYRIITENTLDEENQVEKYRNDTVIVWDPSTTRTIYEAPHHKEVQRMMNDLFNFIRAEDNLHPIEKASIIHFYFVYIHPFFDGNGRTARAISYMYLLQQGYDFFKFFSISTVVKEHKSKYYKAISDVEENNSDLTYFVRFNTLMIMESILNVLKRLGKEYGKFLLIGDLEKKGLFINSRQKKFITHIIKTEKRYITIEAYQKKYKTSYETARKDLNLLESMNILSRTRSGKKYVYKFVGLNDIGLGELAFGKDD